MSEHHEGPAEVGAPMNYPEHEKTYQLFINGAKYGTLVMVALMVAMAFGFFKAGFFPAAILFIVLVAAGSFLL